MIFHRVLIFCSGQCITKHSVAASWLGSILGEGNHCFNVWTFISFSLLTHVIFLHMIHPTFQHSTISFWQMETERDYLEGIKSRPRGCLGDRSWMLLHGQDPLEGEPKRGTTVLAFFMPIHDVLTFSEYDCVVSVMSLMRLMLISTILCLPMLRHMPMLRSFVMHRVLFPSPKWLCPLDSVGCSHASHVSTTNDFTRH